MSHINLAGVLAREWFSRNPGERITTFEMACMLDISGRDAQKIISRLRSAGQLASCASTEAYPADHWGVAQGPKPAPQMPATQRSVLDLLDDSPQGLNAKEIAARLSLSAGASKHALGRLRGLGLIGCAAKGPHALWATVARVEPIQLAEQRRQEAERIAAEDAAIDPYLYPIQRCIPAANAPRLFVNAPRSVFDMQAA